MPDFGDVSMTLKSMILCPDGQLVNQLYQSFQDIGGISVAKDLDYYPDELELLRLVKSASAHVVFLGIQDVERSLDVARIIEKDAPGVQVVVFSEAVDNKVLVQLMRVGIREFLAPPFHHGNVGETLVRVREQAAKNPAVVEGPTEFLFSFLPSKPGAGTTTAAVNTAIALSKERDTTTLLVDLDLNSGLTRFMLKLDNAYSVLDAAEHAGQLDDELWPQLVTKRDNLDILHSGKINPGVRVEMTQIRDMLDFARKRYKAICVDLSGNMEKYSLEVMQESKRIFLVCTSELPSLHLAREKFQFLQKLDLGERVSILLNRTTKRQLISPEQIEQQLGLPVAMSLPNDYTGVHRALNSGQEVDPKSELGQVYTKLAATIIERRASALAAKKKSKGLADLLGFGGGKTPLTERKA
jgi:pilus assembly protein CpaE